MASNSASAVSRTRAPVLRSSPMCPVVKMRELVGDTGTVAVVAREAGFRQSPTGPGRLLYVVLDIMSLVVEA